MTAAGCAGLPGERWEVRAWQPLGRGAVSVQASSEDNNLHVWLTLSPPPGEEAYMSDIFLTSAGSLARRPRARPSPAEPLQLRPDHVQPVGRRRGSIGVGFLYSTGDVDRYVARHTEQGYYGPDGSSGPERLHARWTLVGPWAEARELELVVVARLGVYPRAGEYAQQARFLLIRPGSRAESPLTPSHEDSRGPSAASP